MFSAVQFCDNLEKVKEQLKDFEIVTSKPKRCGVEGQLLGCDCSSDSLNIEEVDAFLYIGDGRFHPLALVYGSSKDVVCYNPKSNHFEVLTKKDVEKIDKLNNWIDSTRELMNVFGEDIDLEIEKTEEVDVEFKRDIKVKVGFLGDLSGGEIGVDYVLVPKKTRRKEKITIKGKKRLK